VGGDISQRVPTSNVLTSGKLKPLSVCHLKNSRSMQTLNWPEPLQQIVQVHRQWQPYQKGLDNQQKVASRAVTFSLDPLLDAWLWLIASQHFLHSLFHKSFINIVSSQLVGGMEHEFYFSIQLGIILPFDFHIFQRGRYTTNQILIMKTSSDSGVSIWPFHLALRAESKAWVWLLDEAWVNWVNKYFEPWLQANLVPNFL